LSILRSTFSMFLQRPKVGAGLARGQLVDRVQVIRDLERVSLVDGDSWTAAPLRAKRTPSAYVPRSWIASVNGDLPNDSTLKNPERDLLTGIELLDELRPAVNAELSIKIAAVVDRRVLAHP